MSDPLDALTGLPLEQNYTNAEKYHDFRKVFSTAEGQRVLRELLSWGHIFQPVVQGSPVDPYALAIRGAEHNYALKLLFTYCNEPAVQPNTQKREK